jgi:hypothetical protein
MHQHGVLQRRRVGTSVYYGIRDARVSQLLAVAREILASAVVDSQTLLTDLDVEPDEPVGG